MFNLANRSEGLGGPGSKKCGIVVGRAGPDPVDKSEGVGRATLARAPDKSEGCGG